MAISLQDLTSPHGMCFGCGSNNTEGLQLKSYWNTEGSQVVASILPDAKYCGWPELVYGGFIAMLVDCHSNRTAMAHHYRAEEREPGSQPFIECVTGHLGIKYIKPTPMGQELTLRAWVEGPVGRKSQIICEVYANDVLTAIGDSIFVRVDTSRLADQAHVR